jgi:GT2 family glycosyltransferase/SAM-dependent methyltransferase
LSSSNDIPELTFTGERVVPGKTPTLLVLEHLVRYRFARRFSKGLKVLDVGCGTGYGAAVLAETADLTAGIDTDAEAIRFAHKTYPLPNLHFAVSDCMQLPFPDGFFELAVSFEVIEHVREQEQCLSEIRRVVSPGGILVMSTPNVSRATKVIEGDNPFHYRELGEVEFRELLSSHFDGVQLFYQHELSASSIQTPAAKTTDPIDLVEDLSAGPAAKYFIAVCGGRPKAVSRRRSVGVAGIETQIADVQYLRQVEKEVSALLAQREQIQSDHRRQIDALYLQREQIEADHRLQIEDRRREYDRQVAVQTEVIRSRDQQIGRMHEEIVARDRRLVELDVQNTLRGIELEWLYRWIPLNKLARKYLFGKNLRERFMARFRSPAKPGLPTRSLKPEVQKREDRDALEETPLKFETPTDPQVSVIIPICEGRAPTDDCLKSLLRHAGDLCYEILVVEDGSGSSVRQMLSRAQGLRLLHSEKNRGFIDCCNLAAAEARGKHLLFLDHAVVVAPNGLKELLKTFDSHPKAGAVGGKLVRDDGRLLEAGSIVWRDGSASSYGHGDDPLKPEYSYVREVDFCSAACLMIRKEIFQEVGGFDTNYMPACYEDADLCMGIREKGYKVFYQPKAVMFHREDSSGSPDRSKNSREENRLRFAEKWREQLRAYDEYSPSRILPARDRRNHAKILVVDDRVPASDAGSGYPRAYALVKFLSELQYKVTLFPVCDPAPYQPYLDHLQQRGVEVMLERADFAGFCTERAGFYDLVLVSRPHNLKTTYFSIKDFFPNAGLIYDAEALFFKREELKAKAKGENLSPRETERAALAELGLLSLADAIICVSESEKTLICQKTGVKASRIFVWGHPLPPEPTPRTSGERNGILFVGAFPTPGSPNEDALIYFLEEIFPAIEREIGCSFCIVGAQPPDSVRRYESSRVKVLGYVRDLSESYDASKVFVVPHRYSAGIPWKLSEAMSRGIPSVVSSLTAAQLDLTDGEQVLVGGTPSEFAAKVIQLYQDEALWHEIRENALAFIRETHDPAVLKSRLDNIIRSSLHKDEAMSAKDSRRRQ